MQSNLLELSSHKGFIDIRYIQSGGIREWYITASDHDPYLLYGRVKKLLKSWNGHIVEERLFADRDVLPEILNARSEIFGHFDDGVAPTLLVPFTTPDEPISLQLHAIDGIERPSPLCGKDGPVARMFHCNGYHYLTASGLCGNHRHSASEQTRAAFEEAEMLLTSANASLFDIARTWCWMDDILSWYDDFNRARNLFFTQRQILGHPGRLPASTGIGVSPSHGKIGIDLFAAWGKPETVTRFHAAGNQKSAYEYGSAFARASAVKTPGGQTVFCSGTAAIDTAGKTCFTGDIARQVAMTIQNVEAVLREMHCRDNDVVQAIAYCATPQVQTYFLKNVANQLPWPILTMIGDVCRSDLLFEVEVTALPAAKKY